MALSPTGKKKKKAASSTRFRRRAAAREAGMAARRRDFSLTGGSGEVRGARGLPWHQPQDAPGRGAFKGGENIV